MGVLDNTSQGLGGMPNIPNILKTGTVLVGVGYGTLADYQVTNSVYKDVPGVVWTLMYTVPAGKIFYVSSILIKGNAGDYVSLATGEAESEVTFAAIPAEATNINLTIPLKFAAGTKISGKGHTAGTDFVTLIGWEE